MLSDLVWLVKPGKTHVEYLAKLLREAYRALASGAKVGIRHWKSNTTTPRRSSIPKYALAYLLRHNF
jgi:hypothetical protein